MTPTKANKYSMLGKEIIVMHLHRMAIENRCVSIARLSAETGASVASVLARPHDALAF